MSRPLPPTPQRPPRQALYVDERDDVYIASQEEIDEEHLEEHALRDLNDRHQYMEKEGEKVNYYQAGRDAWTYEDDANKTTGFVTSKCGTHLGSFLPDQQGARWCIDLSCIAGSRAA